jgi:hypothetical protein
MIVTGVSLWSTRRHSAALTPTTNALVWGTDNFLTWGAGNVYMTWGA